MKTTTLTPAQSAALEKLEYSLFMDENPMATMRDFNRHLLKINSKSGEVMVSDVVATRRARELAAC